MPQPALTPEQIAERQKGPYCGEARKSRAKTHEATVAAGRPKCPTHLCPEARAEFRRVSKLLGARKTETPGDSSTIAVYAEVYSRWVLAKRELGTALMLDEVVLDSNGQAFTKKKLNPLVRVCADCERQLLALTRAMGLTPDTRDKVLPAKHEAKKHEPGTVGFLLAQLRKGQDDDGDFGPGPN